MRRWMIAAGLCVALVAPAQALSDGSGAAGAEAQGKRGFTITFDAIFQGNKPVKVKNFVFDGVVVSCTTGGDTAVNNNANPLPKMNVNDQKEFKGNFTDGNADVKVTGEFKRHGKVQGTIKITGDFPPDHADCNSGKLGWAGQLT